MILTGEEMNKRKKILIVTSGGGHLLQISRLASLFTKHEQVWVTAPGATFVISDNATVYYGYFPESRNGINFFRNLFLSCVVLFRERPDVVISSGAGVTVPFFIIGTLLRIKRIYIESYDFISYPSLTGKLVYTISDLFLVQHTEQLSWYPRAEYHGSLI
jgi:beta-1,4-N-acetylglucosaminyltransferase